MKDYNTYGNAGGYGSTFPTINYCTSSSFKSPFLVNILKVSKVEIMSLWFSSSPLLVNAKADNVN